MKAKIKKCLILQWTKLPKKFQDIVADWNGFHNDCLIPLRSEFTAKDFHKGMKSVESYWKDQSETNNFKGDLSQFIKEYCLDFEIWVIEQNFDFTDVNEVLIEVSW
jgi:hypothetical protein